MKNRYDSHCDLLTVELQPGEAFYLDMGPNTDDDGALIDYSGCSFQMEIRDAEGTLMASPSVTQEAVGWLSSSSVPTAGWIPGDYYFDIHMVDAAGEGSFLIEKSTLRVKAAVTRVAP